MKLKAIASTPTNGVDHVPSPSTSFLFLFLKPQNPDIPNHNSNPDFLIFPRNQHKINLNQTQTDLQQEHKHKPSSKSRANPQISNLENKLTHKFQN